MAEAYAIRSTLTAHQLANGTIDVKVRRQTTFHGHKYRSRILHNLSKSTQSLSLMQSTTSLGEAVGKHFQPVQHDWLLEIGSF